MKLTIDNVPYVLNVDRAVSLGVLKKERTFTVEFTENEAATLQFILRNVGGSQEGNRKHVDSSLLKFRALGDLVCDKELDRDFTISPRDNSIYLK